MGDRSSKEGANVIAGEVEVAREQTTERGLKSRHAQMIALGGRLSPARQHTSPSCTDTG
jgi:amino acid permease